MATKRRLFVALFAFGFLLFASLGIWQVQRLQWKEALIARVDRRVHAPPVAVPPREEWPSLVPADIEYRHVHLSGVFRHDRETLVDALTELGPGYWVMTPLRTDDGTIMVNRGFVPEERASPDTRADSERHGQVVVDGLLRLSEPKGRLLRPNKPSQGRWYSRDIAAIARAQAVGPVAPFFIDAGPAPNAGGFPIGGMTVVRFRNAHLVYALTWFGLAALSAAGLVLLLRGNRSAKRR